MALNYSLGLSTAMAALGTTKKSAVLYHYPCPDGALAALAAHIYFSATSLPALFFPNTVYAPLAPHHLPLHEIGDLYLLDFVGPSSFVREISPHVSRVVILDHHKTALEMLTGDGCNVGKNVVKILDMERSGATIAYDYFKEKVVGDDKVRELERMRRLFEYIEDGDLWRWRLPNSKAFSSGLKDLNIEFDVRLNPSLFQQAVDADAISELRSELGKQLADKSYKTKLRGIGAVVYRVPELENNQLLKVSLRSLDCEDTTPISQNFGGGGHRNASSFMISSAEFEQWKVQQ
ncbi:uncharacterized protein LOC115748772 isoform X2 [Rhodamnia argentea]|uniref:Uncharacterized protein LOC115748772 isoform X2 n=1 Tax=Rhodamnia argentea TaxID=178133 RepID=A0A8B8Q2F5_9MYRT|nr:uncharacterized protein LOC115748772 isoform X2 [Rhodamnia argentea]